MIHYTVSADGKSAVFPSEGEGPRHRLTYAGTGPKTLSMKFEVASAGKQFQTYHQASARRK